MKAIIIGAGRGKRLMPLTDGLPKCMLKLGDKRVLDWILDSLSGSGIRDVVFIGGYEIRKVRDRYPHLRFCHNTDWPNNNILTSLFCAQGEMDRPFVASYSDIVYRGDVVATLMQSEADICLAVDTDWRRRYVGRVLHPESEAEKVTVENDRVVRVGKHLDPDEAWGEFIGLAKFSERGAAVIRTVYNETVDRYQDRPFHQATSIQKAYLTDMIQELIDRGYAVHKTEIKGGWMELDTDEDLRKAKVQWQ